MKLNIANPHSGLQKTVEVDDEKKLLPFFEKRMGAEVTADSLGSEFEGYVFRVSGGNDKQGFPMMQGVLANHRVRLLFSKGMKCYRPRKKGEKKRKSVRGCIVGPDLAVLNLVLVRRGNEEIPGLTDGSKPRRLGPKRAANIKKLFNLSKTDDVTKYVIRREIEGKQKKKSKAPKIQRLITKSRLQRKRKERSISRKHAILSRQKAEDFKKLMVKWRSEQKEKKVLEYGKKPTTAPSSAAPPSKASKAATGQKKEGKVGVGAKSETVKAGKVGKATKTKASQSTKKRVVAKGAAKKSAGKGSAPGGAKAKTSAK